MDFLLKLDLNNLLYDNQFSLNDIKSQECRIRKAAVHTELMDRELRRHACM